MRVRAIAICFLLLLSLATSSVAQAEEQSQRISSADIDLGTATFDHLEVALGLFSTTLGLGDRFMVGTYHLPWLVALLVPNSVAPNIFAKAEVYRQGAFSASLSSSLFYARLGDVDGDGLEARAFIWPIRAMLSARWMSRYSTSLELTTVYSSLRGDHPAENDTRIHGVAIARSAHIGVFQRIRISQRLTLWGRLRMLMGHSPLLAEADATFSETMNVNIQARANTAELSSGAAAVFGAHLEWSRFALTIGMGYGTWFLPGIYLPIGQHAPIGELNFYVRF